VAKAIVRVERSGAWLEQLETSNGAVLEMAGQRVVGAKVAAPLPLVSESAQ
jgi:hypothetical protein